MITAVNTTLIIESPAFKQNGIIPMEYTCNGINVNPPLIIRNLPENTRSLTIIVDDPDAPGGTFNHWIMWNIPPKERILEGDISGIQGMNSIREYKYYGPCPPSGNAHHYHFKIYALDKKLEIEQRNDKRILLKAMEDHIVAFGELVGLYKS